MQTAEHWKKEIAERWIGELYEEEMRLLVILTKEIHLDAFRAGMLYAANLKMRIAPNEGDGYDVLKQAIRKAAKDLKELP